MELADILLIALVVSIILYIIDSDSGGGRRGRVPSS
jgi:hypothetical protein